MVITSNSNLTKKPLLSIVTEYPKPAVVEKKQSSVIQQHQQQESIISDINEFKEHVSLLKTVQEQLFYICGHATDELAHELISDILSKQKLFTKLEKIIDKKHDNMNMMHLCAMKNKPLCMELLYSKKLSIECKDSKEATPLIHAAANNSLEATAFLLSKDVNTNHRDIWGKSALSISMKNKSYRLAEMLLSQHGTDIHLRGTKGNTVLHSVAQDADLYAVQILVDKYKATPQRRNSDEENVLQLSLGYPDIVQFLCSSTEKHVLSKMITNVNVTGCNIVHDCARHGYLDSLLIILKTIDLSNLTPHQITTLLNSPNRNGDTPLIEAVKQSKSAMVKFLCQCSEVKLNEADNDGNTALYHAAALKNDDIVNMLTCVGASLKPDKHVDNENERNIIISFFRSLKTLLTVILSSVALVCIVVIAGKCSTFYEYNSLLTIEQYNSNFYWILCFNS
jgi:ankyrin repeat protein